MCICISHIYMYRIHTYTYMDIHVHELREMGRVGGKKERGGNNANMEITYEIIKSSLRLEPLRGN